MATHGSVPRGPSRSASFQKMLELEKRYKLERLQTISLLPPSQRRTTISSNQTSRNHSPSQQQSRQQSRSPPRYDSPTRHDSPDSEYEQEQAYRHSQGDQQHYHHSHAESNSLQQHSRPFNFQDETTSTSTPKEELKEFPFLPRSDPPATMLTEEQSLLMMRAVRKSVPVPALSIAIPPPPAASAKAARSLAAREATAEGNNMAIVHAEASANNRGISFLAPPAEDSEEESICQSPTWEGYRDAEKKERERRKQKKKQREQASKEEKAARKRLGARLSKVQAAPPPTASGGNPRSRLLRSVTEPLSIEYPAESAVDEANQALALAKLTGQPYNTQPKRPPPSAATNSFVGGVKLAPESEETAKRVVETRGRAMEREQIARQNPDLVQPLPFSITNGTLPMLSRRISAVPTEHVRRDSSEQRGGAPRPPLSLPSLFRNNRPGIAAASHSTPNVHEIKTTGHGEQLSQVVALNLSTPSLAQPSSMLDENVRVRAGSATNLSSMNPQDHSRGNSCDRTRGMSHPERKRDAGSEIRTRARAESTPAYPGESSQQPPQIDMEVIRTAINQWPPAPKASSPTASEMSFRTTRRVKSRETGEAAEPAAELTESVNKPASQQLEPPTSAEVQGKHLNVARNETSPTFSFKSNMTSQFEHNPESDEVAPKTASKTKSKTTSKAPFAGKPLSLASNNVAVERAPPSASSRHPGQRSSEQSSASSNADSHDHEQSFPISPTFTTPNTSRPHSRKGAAVLGHADSRFGNSGDDSRRVNGHGSRSASSSFVNLKNSNVSQLSLPTKFTTQHNRAASQPHDQLYSQGSSPTSDRFEDAETGNGHDDKGHGVSFLPPLKHQSLSSSAKAKPVSSGKSESTAAVPPAPAAANERARSMSPAPSSIAKSDTSRSDESDTPSSSGAASYLQEARKAMQAPPPNNTSTRKEVVRASVGLPPRKSSLALTAPKRVPDKPVAKMFVECCSCKFYHDMPSKVYECMASPNSFVEDRRLGVSGAITTMVKCPWCAHNMSKECCAGYMAMVMLKERLH